MSVIGSGRFRLFLPAIIAGVGASLLLCAGCNRSSDSATAENTNTSEPVTSNSSVKAPSSSGSDSSDAEKRAAAVIKELDSITAPPKKFVKSKELVVQWDSPSKSPGDKDEIKPVRMRWQVKEFSDGSTIKDGHYTEWYAPPGHQKMIEGEYVDGLRQGKWTLWHENGKPRRTENFLNGKLEGSWKQYRDDGTLESEECYRNNLRDGKWVDYDSTGKHIDAQREYKAGVPNGVQTYYYDEPTTKLLVERGVLKSEEAKALLTKQQKKLEQHFKDGQADGEFTAWWPNGNIEATRHYKNGRLDGPWIEYKETGEVTKRINYSGGQIVSTTNAPPASP